MATAQRLFQKNGYYHIYNRGNRKEKIFLEKRDYLKFLKRITEYLKKFDITFLCYCLLPNHFHFLLRQNKENQITPFMLRLGTSYAKYFNTKYGQVGRLFQERFRAKLVEKDDYLLELSRYIHLNPVSSIPAVELDSYTWFSYPLYQGKKRGEQFDFCDTSIILDYFSKKNPRADYHSFLKAKVDNFNNIRNIIIESDPWG